MAAPKAVWGIDLGQCALKAIKLQYDPKEEKGHCGRFRLC